MPALYVRQRCLTPPRAASSVRTPDDVAPDGALSVWWWHCYKYASLNHVFTGLTAGVCYTIDGYVLGTAGPMD
jgi:hypothetical protein